MRRIISYFVLLLGFTGFLAFRIQAGLLRSTPAHAAESGGFLFRTLGGAKEIIGDMMYLKADSYFHGGVTEENYDAPCELKGGAAMAGGGLHAGCEHEGHDHGHECEHHDHDHGGECDHPDHHRDHHGHDHERGHEHHDHPPLPPARNWIHAVNRQIKVHRHAHLHGEDEAEIVPLLAMANRLNTHHIDAILTTAYWLSERLHKPEEAVRLLGKGIRDNPEEWRLDYRLGLIYRDRLDEAGKGNLCFARAVDKSEKARPEDYLERLALVEAMRQIGGAEEAEGGKESALWMYRKALLLFEPGEDPPIRHTIEERLRVLAEPKAAQADEAGIPEELTVDGE